MYLQIIFVYFVLPFMYRYKDGARLERNAPVLVEHSVRGKHSGRYSCEAVNAEGAARCQEIVIAVNSGDSQRRLC